MVVCLASSAAAQRTFDVEGFVVDRTNRAVPGATVALEGVEIAAQTDSLGGFVLRNVPPGDHSVTARVGCVMSGHIDGMRVPRPVRVPLPIRLDRVHCDDTDLGASAQAALVARAVNAFTKADLRGVATALLTDGAVRLLDGGNVSIDAATIGEVSVPIAHLPQESDFPEAIWLSLCLAARDEHSALVRVVRSSPPVPEELDIFVGDAALFSFTRTADPAEWVIARQLVCVDADPIGGVGSVPE